MSTVDKWPLARVQLYYSNGHSLNTWLLLNRDYLQQYAEMCHYQILYTEYQHLQVIKKNVCIITINQLSRWDPSFDTAGSGRVLKKYKIQYNKLQPLDHHAERKKICHLKLQTSLETVLNDILKSHFLVITSCLWLLIHSKKTWAEMLIYLKPLLENINKG